MTRSERWASRAVVNKELSIYLDAIRLTAALLVFICHVSGLRLTGGLLWQLAPLGPEAVTVFFVLSGFVIGYATDTREHSPRTYAINRAARIYSVALPALVITVILDSLGRMSHPDFYSESWGYTGYQAWEFLTGALFLNEIWFFHVNQGSNLPYWSLGYEVWYYVIYGLAVFAPGRIRVPATLIAVLLAGPRIMALFPLWLLGLGTYRLCRAIELRRVTGAFLCVGAGIAWIAYEVWAHRRGRLIGLAPEWIGRPEFVQDYLVGGLFAVHLIGFRFVSPALTGITAPLTAPIRWAAGATFSIYLMHLPVAQFLTTQVPWPPSFWATRLVMILGTLAVVFAIAQFAERRKDSWRQVLTILLNTPKQRLS
jgi:peptidoglycan/LPS O-acetylase OafA/YrhL